MPPRLPGQVTRLASEDGGFQRRTHGGSVMFKKVNESGRGSLTAVVALSFIVLLAGAGYAQEAIRIVVNGKEVTGDVPPRSSTGAPWCPCEVVADALGAQVDWDAARGAIITQKHPKPK